jgi:17beta-estradiol 17-dehydrogenase / very-long-chain 3-oxoacyl-CoA reductase
MAYIIMLDYFFFSWGIIYLTGLFIVLARFAKSLTAKSNLSKYHGSWALITACTDGIGLGFAEECAKSGMNIIQVARNPEKMRTVASNLKSLYGVDVLSVPFDFESASKDPKSAYLKLYSAVSHLDISLIVNNIGTGNKTTVETFSSSVFQNALNLWPIAFITRLFLPKLLERPQGGGIINLSSICGYEVACIPFTVVYSAGKAFGSTFTDVISCEMSKNVDVLNLQPKWVDTPMSKPLGRLRELMIDKNTCAREALKQLGVLTKTFGHYRHWLAFYLTSFLSMLGITRLLAPYLVSAIKY